MNEIAYARTAVIVSEIDMVGIHTTVNDSRKHTGTRVCVVKFSAFMNLLDGRKCPGLIHIRTQFPCKFKCVHAWKSRHALHIGGWERYQGDGTAHTADGNALGFKIGAVIAVGNLYHCKRDMLGVRLWSGLARSTRIYGSALLHALSAQESLVSQAQIAVAIGGTAKQKNSRK